jgi:DNA-binding transcriptional regulator YhcF (GntR family)
MKVITIQENSRIPKYKQIILSIEKSIENGVLQKNDKLPSISKVALEFNLSRDTILLAYDNLKKRGIIYAIFGKGYYVRSSEIALQQRVFLLFDELNSFKEDLYNSFILHMGPEVQIDIFFHHFNAKVFERHINESNGNYTKYMIMPTNLANVATYIATLPEKEVYIVDQTTEELKNYPAVYQNFKKDIYNGLQKGKTKLKKYNKLTLIFSGSTVPVGIKEGFLKFAEDFNFENEVITEFKDRTIQKGEVFIIPDDRDLVNVIEKSKTQKLKLGKDFGIISYNETPLKKLVKNGISTISTDFQAMGKILAQMTFSNKKTQIENKSDLIIRGSL